MKNERSWVIAGMICLFVLIFAALIVTVRYARADPPLTRLEWRTHPPDAGEGGDYDAAD